LQNTSAPRVHIQTIRDGSSAQPGYSETYNNNLSKALKANENTPLGYGSEFQTPQELHKVFSLHPLWSQMESILRNGSKWPLEEIREENRQ
jgi:hypothetical protein